MKSYTDLEQSKKLAEILPLESADMYYGYGKDKPEFLPYSDAEVINLCLPCWSLAKLLDILKDKIIFGGASDNEWFVSYTTKNPTKVSFIYKSNLVDACYEMIISLNELNLL